MDSPRGLWPMIKAAASSSYTRQPILELVRKSRAPIHAAITSWNSSNPIQEVAAIKGSFRNSEIRERRSNLIEDRHHLR